MSKPYRALLLGAPLTDEEGVETYNVDEYNVPEGKSLKFLQGACGGIVQVIDLRHPEFPDVIASLWMGEEAKQQGHPRNRFAEEVAIAGGWAGPEWGDWIAGNCVLTGIDHEAGETVGVPEEWVALIDERAAIGYLGADLDDHMDTSPIQFFGPEGPQ